MARASQPCGQEVCEDVTELVKGGRGVRSSPGDGLVLVPAPRPTPRAPAWGETTQPGHFHKTSFNISHENEEKAQNPLTGGKKRLKKENKIKN